MNSSSNLDSNLLVCLLKNMRLAQSGAFDVMDELPNALVDINVDKLQKEDISIIQTIFDYFLIVKPNIQSKLTVCLRRSLVIKANSLIIDEWSCNQSNLDAFRVTFIENFRALSSSILTKGFLNALFKHHLLPINWHSWTDSLLMEMDKLGLELDQLEGGKANYLNITTARKVIDHLIENLETLCEYYNDTSIWKEVISSITILLINCDYIFKLNDIPGYRKLIAESDGKPNFYLHLAMLIGKSTAFEFLLGCITAEQVKRVDDQGNTLLHFCNSEDMLETALSFSPVNTINNAGDTALHQAIIDDNLIKVRFLLAHGADPAIKNAQRKDMWTIEPGPMPTQDVQLALYRQFKRWGDVLRVPPQSEEQIRADCGYIAVASAANYYRLWHPELFWQPPVVAKALYKKRNELGIGGHGEIFDVRQLGVLIHETECDYQIHNITDFNSFEAVIVTSMKNNAPIIVPHANQFNSIGEITNGWPRAINAHYAMAIGWGYDSNKKLKILLSHYNKYEIVLGTDLFLACCGIGADFPGCYVAKVKFANGKSKWCVSETEPPTRNEITKVRIIPKASLEFFRRKLVTVLPPKSNDNTLTGGEIKLRKTG